MSNIKKEKNLKNIGGHKPFGVDIDPNKDLCLAKDKEKGQQAYYKGSKMKYDDYVNESYDTLPPHLKKALKGKGKVAGKNKKNHFLGYKATNPETGEEYIAYDHSDPNIRRDENGKPEILRNPVSPDRL